LPNATQRPESERPAPPLQGLRVLELASILAGPATGQFLAELGAEVIKVENPATGGDPTRGWRLAAEAGAGSVSAYFSCANWGKKSIALDLASSAGRQVVHDLCGSSDIVIASFKPGDDRKLGLDPQTLQGLNERLIYAQISAYGGSDPRPGFDAIIQAESGFTYMNGEADGEAVKMPVALVDLLAAHQLKEAILLALLDRANTGRGRRIHVALLDAALASLANQASNYLVAGVIPRRMGSEHPNIVPYGAIYQLGDGRGLVLAVGTQRQWQALADAIGRTSLTVDPRFADNQARVSNRRLLHDLLSEAFRDLDSASAAQRLRDAGVPFGFVNDMRQAFDQPQAARVLLHDASMRGVRTFVADGIERAVTLSAPPEYNGDGESILEGLGYDKSQRDELRRNGAWPGQSPGP
jgi:crotonobetainyl-CoA:carnitine CoA-transferase CaiB-like acyl-CoA transferase